MGLPIEWAAGFFEGEGSACVYQKTGGNFKLFQLSVNQVDRRALDTFKDIVGIGIVRGPYGPYAGQLNKKPIYQWKVAGEEALTVARLLLPYLFGKGEQLAHKMQEYETRERYSGPQHTASGHFCSFRERT